MVRQDAGNSICSIRAVLKVCLSTVSKRFEKVYWWNVLKFGYFSVPFKKWERTKFSLNCVLKSEIFYRQRFYVWPYTDLCVEQKKYGFSTFRNQWLTTILLYFKVLFFIPSSSRVSHFLHLTRKRIHWHKWNSYVPTQFKTILIFFYLIFNDISLETSVVYRFRI